MGRSAADGESVGSGGVPRGIEDAQARMPASLPPTQGLREGEARRGWALEQPWDEARYEYSSSWKEGWSNEANDGREDGRAEDEAEGCSEFMQLWEQ